jgi:hypothetical protein
MIERSKVFLFGRSRFYQVKGILKIYSKLLLECKVSLLSQPSESNFFKHSISYEVPVQRDLFNSYFC